VLAGVWVPALGLSLEQAPQPALKYLDEMDEVSAWKALASDGVSASVRGAKGVEGNALVLEFDLAKTAGYAVATRVLPTTLPDDYEISFWMRAEAGRNHLEVKFVDASGHNVWWFRRANYQFSGDWQKVRIKRRQIEFAWGATTILRAALAFLHAANLHQYKPNAAHWRSRSSSQGWQDLDRRESPPERRSNGVLPQPR